MAIKSLESTVRQLKQREAQVYEELKELDRSTARMFEADWPVFKQHLYRGAALDDRLHALGDVQLVALNINLDEIDLLDGQDLIQRHDLHDR